MKKICLCFMLFFSILASAQRHCDMEVIGGITSTTITIDPSGATPTYFEIFFRNNGIDTLKETDTIFFSSTYLTGGNAGYISPVLLDPGGTISINDTAYFKTGPADGAYQFCDSVWVTSIASDLALDTSMSNNYNCQTVTVMEKKPSALDEVSLATGVEKIKVLGISPNPASLSVTLDFVSRNNSEVLAGIYDVSGRLVYNHNYSQCYKGQSGYSLDISSLQSGIYFIRVRQGAVEVSGKLFKQ